MTYGDSLNWGLATPPGCLRLFVTAKKKTHFDGINDNNLCSLGVVRRVCGTRITATGADIRKIFTGKNEMSNGKQRDAGHVSTIVATVNV